MASTKTSEEFVTPQELAELLSYDPETGGLTWLPRPLRFFRDGEGRYTAARAKKIFDRQFANTPALNTHNPAGYLRGNLFGRSLMSHRAAYALMTGHWPEDQIDHINGVRDDNRWVNLRPVTNRQNQHNSRSAKNSSSRYIGVSSCRKTNRWVAYICPDGRKINLGAYNTEEEAAKVRDEKALELFGEYARLNFER